VAFGLAQLKAVCSNLKYLKTFALSGAIASSNARPRLDVPIVLFMNLTVLTPPFAIRRQRLHQSDAPSRKAFWNSPKEPLAVR